MSVNIFIIQVLYFVWNEVGFGFEVCDITSRADTEIRQAKMKTLEGTVYTP
jgi:hypothetical protein